MAWYDWNQSDLTCAFSPERATENRVFLENAFVGLSPTPPTEVKTNADSPFQTTWQTTGAGAFLEINWLAEDLRLLIGVEGISSVLRDLTDRQLCHSTWHMLHTAALFERARPGAVLSFLESTDGETPDFLVQVDGQRVPVEAKLLTLSKDEERFVAEARKIAGPLLSMVSPNSIAVLAVKKPVRTDIAAAVLQFCRGHLPAYSGVARSHFGPLCNLFVEPMQSSPGIGNHRAYWILAPVPDTENLRVLQRAKKASRQLRSFPTARDSGIVSIGLSDSQDGCAVFERIGERVQKGRLSGIAAVLLLKKRTHLSPPRRTTFDLLEVRKNPNATSPIHGEIPLRPFDGAALLSQVEPSLGGIRAYRMGAAEGTIQGDGAGLYLPDIRVLTREMLQ
jgi:hypothetical protein